MPIGEPVTARSLPKMRPRLQWQFQARTLLLKWISSCRLYPCCPSVSKRASSSLIPGQRCDPCFNNIQALSERQKRFAFAQLLAPYQTGSLPYLFGLAHYGALKAKQQPVDRSLSLYGGCGESASIYNWHHALQFRCIAHTIRLRTSPPCHSRDTASRIRLANDFRGSMNRI